MNNPFSLEGKTILVTGASSGIGQATAIECSKMGAKVIITGRNQARLQETYHQLVGDGHLSICCDLGNIDEINQLIENLPEIQGFVNNAGITKILPVNFIDENSFKNILDINTVAPVLLLRLLLKKKKLQKNSSVVFTSSISGLGFTAVGGGMYAASKGAISAFVKCAALELSAKQIRVNAVCPGVINTNIFSEGTISQEQLEKDEKNYPLGRFGRPEEVAWAMIYLLSDASAWVTGTNMIIDGGYSIR